MKFNTTKPSSTKTVIDLPTYGEEKASIRKYKPNLIDRLGNALPDTGPIGVLKGLYRGTDDNLFGLLPSGRYQSSSKESDLGKSMSYVADPFAFAKAGKFAVSGGTPISRLIANSINPQAYSNKWPEIKRVLTNPKVFKEAVIDDIPQWAPVNAFNQFDDRLFAWRKKLGLGKPNEKYNRALDLGQYKAMESAKKQLKHIDSVEAYRKNTFLGQRRQLERSAYQDIINNYQLNNPINKIWNRFGTHTENGKKYYHYKNPEDYFANKTSNTGHHALFGGYSPKTKMKGSKDFGGVLREDYYDNWDFARNTSFKKRMKTPMKRLLQGDVKGFVKRELKKLPVSMQRNFAEMFLQPLEFKGTAKKVYKKPRPKWIDEHKARIKAEKFRSIKL